MASTTSPGNYPTVKVDHITDPSRFYAFLVIGILVKIIMLIPVFIYLIILAIGAFVMLVVNSFVVLFSGKYWQPCYDLVLGIMRYTTKMQLFVSGLTNRYPGFSLENDDPLISVDMPMPTAPNRWFAIPLFGGIARLVMLIPFLIWTGLVRAGSQLGVFVSFVPVLFQGKYPETTYELERDHQRLELSGSAYMAGFADNYPSFLIDWNHKAAKIVLIVIGVLLSMANSSNSSHSNQNYNYQNKMMQNNAQYQEMMKDYTPPSDQ